MIITCMCEFLYFAKISGFTFQSISEISDFQCKISTIFENVFPKCRIMNIIGGHVCCLGLHKFMYHKMKIFMVRTRLLKIWCHKMFLLFTFHYVRLMCLHFLELDIQCRLKYFQSGLWSTDLLIECVDNIDPLNCSSDSDPTHSLVPRYVNWTRWTSIRTWQHGAEVTVAEVWLHLGIHVMSLMPSFVGKPHWPTLIVLSTILFQRIRVYNSPLFQN